MQSKHNKKTDILDRIERVIRGARLRSMGFDSDVLMALAHYLWEDGEDARVEWREMHYKALPGNDHSVTHIYALALPDYGILMDRNGHFGWSDILKFKADTLVASLGKEPAMLTFTDGVTHIKGSQLIDSYQAEVIREKIRARAPEIEARAIDQRTVSVAKMGRMRRI